jgi:hypothetical protein
MIESVTDFQNEELPISVFTSFPKSISESSLEWNSRSAPKINLFLEIFLPALHFLSPGFLQTSIRSFIGIEAMPLELRAPSPELQCQWREEMMVS